MTQPFEDPSAPVARLNALLRSGSPILDAHVHVGTWDRAPWTGLGADWQGTVEVLCGCGIQGAVFFPTSPSGNHALLEQMLAGPDYPAWSFAWVSPKVPESLRFLEEHGDRIAGLKLHPSFDLCRLDDPRLKPMLDLAGERGWIVQVHCGRWQKMAGYEFVLDAAEERPDTRFLLAHMGGDAPELKLGSVRGMHERGLGNAWIELSCTREYWIVERLVEEYGAERLCYGSDFNMHHPLAVMTTVVGAGLDDTALRPIMGGNLAKLLEGRPQLLAGGTA